jgi:hypothetical protein
VVAQVRGEFLDRQAIHPRTALVPLHTLERAPQIPRLDDSFQQTRIVEP